MKKALSALVILILLISLVACGVSEDIQITSLNGDEARFVEPKAIGGFDLLSDEAPLLLGDINLDGKINNKDVLKLFKYIYNPTLYPIDNLRVADVNLDGDIDNKDVLMLFKHIYNPTLYPFPVETVPRIDGVLPSNDALVKEYECGDGMILNQYSGMTEENYDLACIYFQDNGYTRYCSDSIGSSRSATYVKGDEYYTLLLANKTGTLYLGYKESGANLLPAQNEEYEVVTTTTVTQGYSKNINGMTYIVRLADNSFIVIDGGYTEDAANLYNTLCSLSSQSSGILIRAWLLSHAHSDHYPAFTEFANTYADNVVLESVMYSPVPENRAGDNTYFNGEILVDIAKFEGANAVTVHAGMTFNFADVTLEVLNTSEYVYKDYTSLDFNESSSVFRVKNETGSVIFLGDGYSKVSRFLIDTYGDGLKTEMMQVSHHGVEQATVELYEIISPSLAFWPCDEWLLRHERGTTTKQYLLSCETIYEHVIHGYGNTTRPLSYKAQPKESLQLITDSISVKGSAGVTNIKLENGVISYEVCGSDPHVYFTLSKGISTEDYNAVKIVVKDTAGALATSDFFFTCSNDATTAFNTTHKKTLGTYGTSEDGVYTLLVYLGNITDYTGDIKAIRFDAGTEIGQTVEIRSIELFYIDIDK